MVWRDFRNLQVWEKGMALCSEVYSLTKALPKEELFGLTSQLQRAAVSIPSNIAEGRGRQTEKEFCNFLSIARGSCCEVITQLLICKQLGYLDEKQIDPALDLCDEVGRMLSSLMQNLE